MDNDGIVQVWTVIGKHCTELDQTWTMLGQVCHTVWPILSQIAAGFDRVWTDLDQLWSISTPVGPIWPNSAEFDQHGRRSSKVGRSRQTLANFVTHFGRCGLTLDRLRHRSRPTSG